MFVVTPTSDEVFCVSRNPKGFKDHGSSNLANPDLWNFSPDKTKWNHAMIKVAKGERMPSFINAAINELKLMHIVASVLLLLANISIRRSTGTVLNYSSVFKIATIPLYLGVLFRAEQAIRKYRTVYKNNSPKDFTFS